MKPFLVSITVLAAFSTSVAAQPPGLVVSVAASMHDAVAEIADLYRTAAGVTVAINTGGSNTLARQIVEGAPAAVFLSADDLQMDVVEKAGRLVAGSRVALLTNDLVVIVPKPSSRSARGAPADQKDPPLRVASDLTRASVRRVAMGEPSSVPAGVYGRKWLESLALWPSVQSKVVPFPTVRAVVAAVEAGRADAGIVYRTDVIVSTGVDVPIVVATRGNPDLRIVHSAAVVKGPGAEAGAKFLSFLQGAAAQAVFARRGFGPKP